MCGLQESNSGFWIVQQAPLTMEPSYQPALYFFFGDRVLTFFPGEPCTYFARSRQALNTRSSFPQPPQCWVLSMHPHAVLKLVGNLGVVDCGCDPSTWETKAGDSLFEASVMVCLLRRQPARDIEGHWPEKPKSKQTKQAKMEIVWNSIWKLSVSERWMKSPVSTAVVLSLPNTAAL